MSKPNRAPIVAPEPTSDVAAPIPGGPPFVHFPDSRGDMLAGQPVPQLRTADAIAAMPQHALMRRLKVLRAMMGMRRLGPQFAAAARAETLALCDELRRRLNVMLTEALKPTKRGARVKPAKETRTCLIASNGVEDSKPSPKRGARRRVVHSGGGA